MDAAQRYGTGAGWPQCGARYDWRVVAAPAAAADAWAHPAEPVRPVKLCAGGVGYSCAGGCALENQPLLGYAGGHARIARRDGLLCRSPGVLLAFTQSS